MWKRVRTLFIKELLNSKFFQYLFNGHFEYGFNTSKIAKIIFAFIFVLSLTIYLSRKVEVNKYLIKKISSNKSCTLLRVNINSANEQELNNLPSIGPKLAKRIIEYRFIHGSFESLDEIRAVKGLGAKKFSQIENYLTVQP